MLTVKIIPNASGSPAGKLADAEIKWSGAEAGPLNGCKLMGFAIWERRGGPGRNVTFPARTYSVNGERRSFALLRAATDTEATHAIRDLILDAMAAYDAAIDTEPIAPGPAAGAPRDFSSFEYRA